VQPNEWDNALRRECVFNYTIGTGILEDTKDLRERRNNASDRVVLHFFLPPRPEESLDAHYRRLSGNGSASESDRSSRGRAVLRCLAPLAPTSSQCRRDRGRRRGERRIEEVLTDFLRIDRGVGRAFQGGTWRRQFEGSRPTTSRAFRFDFGSQRR